MRKIKDNNLSERRNAAAEAKAALVKNFRIAKDAAEPMRQARQEERKAAAQARDELRAAREQAKLEEQERLQAEIAEHQAAAEAVVEANEAAEGMRISRAIEDEAAQKAARDLRYAKRKARQR